MVRCASCSKKFRIQEPHVMRSITPQAKPEYVQAIHKEAESLPSEGATSLSGLSDLMQREAMPPRDAGKDEPLPAGQRRRRITDTQPSAPPPQQTESQPAASTESETGDHANTSALAKLRRIRSSRAQRVAVIAGVSGLIIAGVILAIVLWLTDTRPGLQQRANDAGPVATPDDDAIAFDGRNGGEAVTASTPRRQEENGESELPARSPADTHDTSTKPAAGDDIATIMGMTDGDPVTPDAQDNDSTSSPPPVEPVLARLLLSGGWQSLEMPRSPVGMKPDRPGRVQVTTTRQEFQPDKGIVVSVDFVNRSSRTAAVVDFSAVALHAQLPRVIARRRAAFALMEAGETHTVSIPLPARYTHDRVRVDAWVDHSVALADAWRALDPRIDNVPDSDRPTASLQVSLTNGNVQTARAALASVQGLDAQGTVMSDVLLHWKLEAEPMDRVTLNAILPPSDAGDPEPSQYNVRAYLLASPDPPPGVFTSPVEPEATPGSAAEPALP